MAIKNYPEAKHTFAYPAIGKTYNAVRDIQCPRCGEPMQKINDAKQAFA